MVDPMHARSRTPHHLTASWPWSAGISRLSPAVVSVPERHLGDILGAGIEDKGVFEHFVYPLREILSG